MREEVDKVFIRVMALNLLALLGFNAIFFSMVSCYQVVKMSEAKIPLLAVEVYIYD